MKKMCLFRQAISLILETSMEILKILASTRTAETPLSETSTQMGGDYGGVLDN